MIKKELKGFNEDVVATFRKSMEDVGVDTSKMDCDKVEKMFDNFDLYDKIVSIFENRREIIGGYIKYTKAMLMLRNFGDCRFTIMMNDRKQRVLVCDYKKGDKHPLVIFKKIRDDGLLDYKTFEMIEEEFWKRAV